MTATIEPHVGEWHTITTASACLMNPCGGCDNDSAYKVDINGVYTQIRTRCSQCGVEVVYNLAVAQTVAPPEVE